MRPLVYHSVALRDIFFVTLGVAAVTELAIQVGTRSGGERDPSYVWMIVGSALGLVLAFRAAGSGAHLPGPSWTAPAVGIALMCAGMLLRYWSVRTLGRFFTVTVDVGADHELVDTGPYARVRHPSYTGMLVVYLGAGVALDSWLSVAAAVVPPAAAVVNRIRHEERLLRTRLGARYVDYADRTRRLEEKWIKWSMGVPLVVLSSPYRSLLQPFLDYAGRSFTSPPKPP